ncbi:MAG: hypothetical protein ACHQ53_11675 [Polyangiales bacterium]
MPKAACFEVAGVDLRFDPSDHLPPHFHAERAREWAVRVFFLSDPKKMIQVEYSNRKNRPHVSDLKEIVKQAAAHRIELYMQWQAVVNVTTRGPER